MNVLSLFDGISCGQIALNRANIQYNKYFASEIKEYAIKCTQYNYPNTIQLGDVKNIKSTSLPKIDLLMGGSPCQDFSGANLNRSGLKGDKSNLFFEYVRLLKELKPKYFLLENVRMKKKDEEKINNILNCKPLKINSSLISPQLRYRLYWTNIPNIKEIKKRNLELNKFLTNGYSDRKKARCLLVSDSRPLTTPIKMAHRYFNAGFTTLIFKSKEHFHKINKHFNLYFKGLTAKEIDFFSNYFDLSIYSDVRYMNNRERERCQNVPDGYTDILTQNEAADVLGDGWTVDVISHILKEIKFAF